MDSSLPSLMDPATGLPLPADAIVRVLQITPKVHVYAIPPDSLPSLSSGYQASTWTSIPDNPIFTARLRVLETSTDSDNNSDSSNNNNNIKVDIILEHPTEGTLFAAAPYTTPAIVTPCSDSSRFFALRVQDPASKKKATLGIGFEERSEAFDFGVVLQESGKHLFPSQQQPSVPKRTEIKSGKEEEEKRDLGLKEGETITVNLGGTKFGRRVRAVSAAKEAAELQSGSGGDKPLNSFALAPPPSLNSFALPPPPGAGSGSGIAPPPNAREARAQKRLSAQQLGFDDGQFGEFA
ncbi:adaptin ear-binding coat-associated protein 1 [Podospora fimiseda]|uniref:Adaptin ear-binding coat-associated protein 1 n=1 Tax=Podospora fimiseda TaxID=252190 RepID=A0AAN7H0Z8_9PEZI|nr:adaptin ear-binding coat-associated protein 1 [Podospora fimiseda]